MGNSPSSPSSKLFKSSSSSTSTSFSLSPSTSTSSLSNHSFEQRIQRAQRTGIVTLTHAKLKQIPSSLSIHGHCIKSLDLSHNKLTATSLDLHSDMFSILRILSLSHNRLTTLPSCLSTLTHLETLDVSFNSITLIPSSPLPLPSSLTHLNLQHNPLRSISVPSHPTLKCLNVSFTQLTQFQCDSELPHLEWLDVSNNQLTQLQLPTSLINLKSIQLNQNPKLSNLDPLVFKLPSLVQLELEGTLIRIDVFRDLEAYSKYEQRRKGRVDQLLNI